jgi:hypothetical protein
MQASDSPRHDHASSRHYRALSLHNDNLSRYQRSQGSPLEGGIELMQETKISPKKMISVHLSVSISSAEYAIQQSTDIPTRQNCSYQNLRQRRGLSIRPTGPSMTHDHWSRVIATINSCSQLSQRWDHVHTRFVKEIFSATA